MVGLVEFLEAASSWSSASLWGLLVLVKLLGQLVLSQEPSLLPSTLYAFAFYSFFALVLG